MIITNQKNIIKAYGNIYEGDGPYFVEMLNTVLEQYDTATIHMHTGGGSVFDGNIMYNALNSAKDEITLIVDGLAASMGAILLTAVDNVKMVRNGYVMIHAPSSFSHSTASEKEKEAKLLRNIELEFVGILMYKTGKTKKEVEKWIEGDNWFSAKEALALGLISEVINPIVVLPIEENPQKAGLNKTAMAYACLLPMANQYNINKQIIMKQQLIEKLGLEGLTAESSDTAIVEAIVQKYEAEKQSKETAQKTIEVNTQASINTLIEDALEDKTISAEKKTVYEQIGKTSGVEALKTVIEQIGKNKPQSVTDIISQSAGSIESRANWTFADWQDKDAKGLEAMASQDEKKFNELFKKQYNK